MRTRTIGDWITILCLVVISAYIITCLVTGLAIR